MKVEKLLLDILLVQSPSYQEEEMILFIRNHCKKKGYHVRRDNNNLYVTKGSGDNFPCYVAHTDTCAKKIPKKEFQIVSFEGNVLAGYNPKKDDFTQVGFDDKIGIFIALKMLDEVEYGKAFFPHAEEVGCIGSGLADMKFFEDCGYLIQCDRRYAEHIVDNVYGTRLMSDEFKSMIGGEGEKYKRKFTTGMLTDVYKLKTKGLEVSCTNLECGYYNPHSDDDHCKLDEVYQTLELVKDVYKATKGMRFEHKKEEPKYTSYYNSKPYKSIYYRDPYEDYWTNEYKSTEKPKVDETSKMGYCEQCGQYDYLSLHDYAAMKICPECSRTFDMYFGYGKRDSWY